MIVVDENVDQFIIDYLRYNHQKILSIREESPGISDREVIEKTKALLITEDKDFGELVFSYNITECSVILLRYDASSDKTFLMRIMKALEHDRSNSGHFFIRLLRRKSDLEKFRGTNRISCAIHFAKGFEAQESFGGHGSLASQRNSWDRRPKSTVTARLLQTLDLKP